MRGLQLRTCNPRAIYYRRMNDIPGDWGTAVNVQTMVFGNMGDTSGTGVAFTRNPSTGEKQIYGEYLINAQGEDVVAGVRTPQPITKLAEDLPGPSRQLKNGIEQINPKITSPMIFPHNGCNNLANQLPNPDP